MRARLVNKKCEWLKRSVGEGKAILQDLTASQKESDAFSELPDCFLSKSKAVSFYFRHLCVSAACMAQVSLRLRFTKRTLDLFAFASAAWSAQVRLVLFRCGSYKLSETNHTSLLEPILAAGHKGKQKKSNFV
ncbi:hypothetical protein Tco_0296822 [Tanacetum coccineum]